MNEIELKTSDKRYSRAVNLKYQEVSVFSDVTKKPCDGEYNVDGTFVRFRNGLLHGGKGPDGFDVPAYETEDGHCEYFTNGLLHREGMPAVISDFGEWEEWWLHGKLIMIRASGRFKAELEKAGA